MLDSLLVLNLTVSSSNGKWCRAREGPCDQKHVFAVMCRYRTHREILTILSCTMVGVGMTQYDPMFSLKGLRKRISFFPSIPFPLIQPVLRSIISIALFFPWFSYPWSRCGEVCECE